MGQVRWRDFLLVEDKPKDVKSVLRGETDTHWNLILPQIDNILIVVVKFKLQRSGTLHLYKEQRNSILCLTLDSAKPYNCVLLVDAVQYNSARGMAGQLII